MYLVNNKIQLTWFVPPTATVYTSADFDITVIDQAESATYSDGGLTDFTAPTATTGGQLIFEFTPNVAGFWTVILSTGTGAAYTEYDVKRFYVFPAAYFPPNSTEVYAPDNQFGVLATSDSSPGGYTDGNGANSIVIEPIPVNAPPGFQPWFFVLSDRTFEEISPGSGLYRDSFTMQFDMQYANEPVPADWTGYTEYGTAFEAFVAARGRRADFSFFIPDLPDISGGSFDYTTWHGTYPPPDGGPTGVISHSAYGNPIVFEHTEPYWPGVNGVNATFDPLNIYGDTGNPFRSVAAAWSENVIDTPGFENVYLYFNLEGGGAAIYNGHWPELIDYTLAANTPVWIKLDSSIAVTLTAPAVDEFTSNSGANFIYDVATDGTDILITTDIGVLRTQNNGASWGSVPSPTAFNETGGIAAGASAGEFMMIDSNGDSWYTTDSGDNWASRGVTTTSAGTITTLNYAKGYFYYTVFVSGGMGNQGTQLRFNDPTFSFWTEYDMSIGGQEYATRWYLWNDKFLGNLDINGGTGNSCYEATNPSTGTTFYTTYEIHPDLPNGVRFGFLEGANTTGLPFILMQEDSVGNFLRKIYVIDNGNLYVSNFNYQIRIFTYNPTDGYIYGRGPSSTVVRCPLSDIAQDNAPWLAFNAVFSSSASYDLPYHSTNGRVIAKGNTNQDLVFIGDG